MDYEVTVTAITEFGIGGSGHYEAKVDFQTAQLMMSADVITITGKPFKVKYTEVTDETEINFYVDEITKKKEDTLKVKDIEAI